LLSTMTNKFKYDSPLVLAVLALQEHLDELERIGERINSTDMSADIDIEFIQKLMLRFANCGQGITEEVSNLSFRLQDAQTRAQTVADKVSRQADAFNIRRNEYNEQWEKFRLLGEKVTQLNESISQFRQAEDRTARTSNIQNLEQQIASLIGELQNLCDTAQNLRMKTLQKNARSLAQTLQAVQGKLRDLTR